MLMRKSKSMLALWMACFAILMAALAPSISHMLASKDGGSAIAEICSVAGISIVSLDQNGAVKKPAPPGSGMNMADCPYCVLHADMPALPPSAFAMLPLDAPVALAPQLFYQSPSPLFAWAPPQSRAPPALS